MTRKMLNGISSILLLISMSLTSFADNYPNELVRTDLQLFQLKGPIKTFNASYYNEDNALTIQWTQYYDPDGFIFMSIVNTYGPVPATQLYQWNQFYRNNQRDFFTLLNNELADIFTTIYKMDSDYYQHQRIIWSDEGAIINTIHNNQEFPDEKILAQEVCTYDDKNRVIRSTSITQEENKIINIHYLSFSEYQNTNLEQYAQDDLIKITANKSDIKNYVENHWNQLDPRVEITYTRYIDNYGNPIIQYRYTKEKKQKILKHYLYY